MAKLSNIHTGAILSLKSHHTFGRRASSVDKVLKSKDISQIHATIRWTGQGWYLYDHSRNGTWLDGRRVLKDVQTKLGADQIIHFGGSQVASWKVIDCQPPQNMLISLSHPGTVLCLNRFHALPDDQEPTSSLYLADTGSWTWEGRNQTKILEDGDILNLGDQVWRFHSAGAEAATLSKNESDIHRESIRYIQFHFQVSRDEEHVRLKIRMKQKDFDLGERAHHYSLLILARQRLKDLSERIEADSCGWLSSDVFCDMLAMDPQHVNIHIFRARKQILQLFPKVNFLPPIVERRMGSLRFGHAFFQIKRGRVLEGKTF